MKEYIKPILLGIAAAIIILILFQIVSSATGGQFGCNKPVTVEFPSRDSLIDKEVNRILDSVKNYIDTAIAKNKDTIEVNNKTIINNNNNFNQRKNDIFKNPIDSVRVYHTKRWLQEYYRTKRDSSGFK